MASKIPKGWDSTPSISDIIETTDGGLKFCIFKTPIRQTATDMYGMVSWTTSDVLRDRPELRQFKSLIINMKPNQGAEIRYDPADFKNQGILYKELFVRGTRKPPPDFLVKEFFNLVDDFVESNPDGVVGVHGTNGVNRPGYFIARYLIEKFGWDPDTAIDTVNSARGKTISEKDGLLFDLRERSSLWETKALQHSLVVKISSGIAALAYKDEAGKTELLREFLSALPVDGEVGMDDVDAEKCIWLGSLHFMIWFNRRMVQKKIENHIGWNEDPFKVERLEDRSNAALSE